MPARLALPIDEIGRRYKGGESAPDIAKALGVTTTTITNRLREIGLSVRGANHRAFGHGGPSTTMLRTWSSTIIDDEFDEWAL